MGISGIRITVLFAIVAAAGVVFVPVVNFSKKSFDKRTQFIAGMSLCAAVMILFRFIGVDSMLSACLFMTAFGIGSMCYWQLIPGMIYDVCGLDELKSGEQRQGTIVLAAVDSGVDSRRLRSARTRIHTRICRF